MSMVSIGQWALTRRDLVFVAIPILFVFSQEIPIAELLFISEFASVNTEDLAVVLCGAVFLIDLIKKDEAYLSISLAGVTSVIVLATGWILISTTVNMIRIDTSVAASYLWALKWIEAVAFLIMLQHIATPRSAFYGTVTLLGSGVVLAGMAIIVSLRETSRVGLTFDNPNVLSSFLLLVGITSLSLFIASPDRRYQVLGGIGAAVSFSALLATESRAAMFGLVIALLLLLVLLRDRISTAQIASIVFIGAVTIISLPLIVGREGVRRLLNWFEIGPGGIGLADTPAARSFEIRYNLVERGLELSAQAPVFGHGWFAAPERIGWLDVHYITLLAEVGIVGLVIFSILYLLILRDFFRIRSNNMMLGSAGTAWYLGLQVQSVAGPFPRIPQIMFITLFFLVCGWTVSHRS